MGSNLLKAIWCLDFEFPERKREKVAYKLRKFQINKNKKEKGKVIDEARAAVKSEKKNEKGVTEEWRK